MTNNIWEIWYTVFDFEANREYDQHYAVEADEATVKAYCDRMNKITRLSTSSSAPYDFKYVPSMPKKELSEPFLHAYVRGDTNTTFIFLSFDSQASCVSHENGQPYLCARFDIVPFEGETQDELCKRAQTIGEEMIAKYKEAHGE